MKIISRIVQSYGELDAGVAVEVSALERAEPKENEAAADEGFVSAVDFVSLVVDGIAEIDVFAGKENEKLFAGFAESPEGKTGFDATIVVGLSSPEPPKLNENPLPVPPTVAGFVTAAFPGGANEKAFDGSPAASELKSEPPAGAAADGLNESAADSSFFSVPGNLKVKVCGAS